MGGGCGPNCTTFTINVPLSTLTDDKRESIRESIIALLQGLEAGKVTVSFREGSTKAYASTKNPVNEETLNGKVTEAGDIQTLGDSKFIIAQINGKATEYNNKLIIVKTDNEIEYIDDVGNPEVVAQTDWTSKGITGDQIKHVAFGKDVKTIADFAFGFCTSLTEVTIGKNVKTIGESAFANCTSLTEVTIDNSVETIGSSAFANCTSLTEVTIGNSVETIGNYAFGFCTSLTEVTIGNSVETIGNYAFGDCTSLTEFSVDAGNTNYYSDDKGVLFNKTVLIQYPVGNTRNTYTIPNYVTTIGDIAFAFCTSLTEINVDAGNTNYSSDDGVLFNNNITELIQYPVGNTSNTYTIPNSVTTIVTNAFLRCTSLTEVTIGNSVETIGESAFGGCTSLTQVTIPNSVETIGDDAFGGCIALALVKWDTTNVTTIPNTTFTQCPAVIDPTNFRVNNVMPDTFGFGADNGDFSGLSVIGGGLEFGDPDSGGTGFKTVKVV